MAPARPQPCDSWPGYWRRPPVTRPWPAVTCGLIQPSVVFLDEPTAGLDPLAARMVRELIVGLKNASRSLVLCTHDLDEAERLADRVVILAHGRIVASDSAAALRASGSKDTVVHLLLAAP